ncbi:MAG: DUF4388 domain-containing protein [Candidatus Eisenbacteria bacterium]|nr:DUF4388 domain-containing protein [Candidatus Latescibacterota bacterium]MBD3301825.1 DUF4388 domain-containing protein [Candidatus Eisenbacteria bacterium]
MAIQGSLQEMSVLEVIQLVGNQRKSATLRFTGPDQECQLHFREGMLVASHVKGGGEAEPFLDTLVALAHLSPAEAIGIREQVIHGGRDLWKAVLSVPHLSKETCRDVYRQATAATLDRVLLWEKGHFAVLAPLQVEPVLTPGESTDSHLLEAMRRLDEVASLKQGDLPPNGVPCVNGPEELCVSSDPLRRAILRQIDGRRTVQEIVAATRLGEYEIYSTLAKEREEGWIQILAPRRTEPERAAPSREILRRWPAVAALATILALGIGSAWIGQRLQPDRRAWVESATQWEEHDLRRMLEVYRFRHGAYPDRLSSLQEEGDLPIQPNPEDRWTYRVDAGAYELAMR